MYCSTCGKEIDDNAAVCTHCGVETGQARKAEPKAGSTEWEVPLLVLSYIAALTLPVAGWVAAAYQFVSDRVAHGIVLLIVSTLITLMSISDYEESGEVSLGWLFEGVSVSGSMPSCDSRRARSMLMEAFNTSQYSRLLEIDAISVRSLEKRGGSVPEHRLCRGLVMQSNAENVSVHYELFPDEENPAQFFIQFEIVE